jgi:hypothetical protein
MNTVKFLQLFLYIVLLIQNKITIVLQNKLNY